MTTNSKFALSQNQYENLIAEVDRGLETLRALLIDAKKNGTAEERAKIKQAIDAALDERLMFMRGRDAVKKADLVNADF